MARRSGSARRSAGTADEGRLHDRHVRSPGLAGARGVHAPLQHQVGDVPNEPESAAGDRHGDPSATRRDDQRLALSGGGSVPPCGTPPKPIGSTAYPGDSQLGHHCAGGADGDSGLQQCQGDVHLVVTLVFGDRCLEPALLRTCRPVHAVEVLHAERSAKEVQLVA